MTEAQFVVDACHTPSTPSGQPFRIRLTDSTEIAWAEAVIRGTSGRFVLGRLAHGDGGFNAPWHWHLKPDSTYLVEAAIELCDACPTAVEAGGLFQLGSFCPVTSRVVRREW